VGHRKSLSRLALLVVALVAVSAAATAAMRWTNWSPLNSCLFCGGLRGSEPPARAASPSGGEGTSGVRASDSRRADGTAFDASGAPIGLAAVNGTSDGSRPADSSRPDWQPWSTSSIRGESGGASATALGGLSRLMSMSITGGASAIRPSTTPTPAPPIVEKTEPPAPAAAAPPAPAPTPETPPTPAPPAPAPPNLPDPPLPPNLPDPPLPPGPTPSPSPAPLPPDPGGNTPTIPNVVPSAPPVVPVVPPTDPFHEHTTNPPDPFVPPPPTGPLDPNDPGGVTPTGSAPSPTPEPGSMLLVATGLAGVFAELRRRRVI